MNAAPQPRRLDPCPCGSGRRFKDCHGRLDRNPRLTRAIERREADDHAGAVAEVEAALAELAAGGAPPAPDPRLAPVFNLQGLLRQDALDLAGAVESFRAALAHAPGFAEAHFNLGLALLMQGEYAAGWPEFAWRERAPGYADYARFPFGIPRWKGEPVAGRRMLVHAEQGMGDTIQFARFLGRLAADGARVEVFCHPPMVELLSRMPGVAGAMSALDERPTQDFHAAMITDVAAHYLPDRGAPHWLGPTIVPRADLVAQAAPILAARPRPHIGLAWKGSSRYANDRRRSLSAAQAARLATGRGTFVSLQVDGDPIQAHAPHVVEVGDAVRGWERTAAFVSGLDLVVSVDTAVAHLAASMGKPTWILSPFSADWRWGPAGETSPWYPSVRLFRQPRPGDWDSVFARVAAAL